MTDRHGELEDTDVRIDSASQPSEVVAHRTEKSIALWESVTKCSATAE